MRTSEEACIVRHPRRSKIALPPSKVGRRKRHSPLWDMWAFCFLKKVRVPTCFLPWASHFEVGGVMFYTGHRC